MDLLPPDSTDALATRKDLAVLGAGLKGELGTEIAGVRTEIAGVRTEMHSLVREQTRTLLLAQLGMWVTTMLAILGVLARH